jgi:predicted RNA-binding protein with EMAP domain
MDYQVLFNLAITAAAFFGGWTLNRIYTAIDRLDSDVRDLPVKYVGKDDYRNDLKEIKEQLSKIIDKLDDKADK